MSQQRFDVIVIGGGHAAAEAAWAAARMGMRTGMVTMSASQIGRMSCNPAIGGIGKGQIVREIDAMGGLMGLATDAVGIQFRMLNGRKGPAVRAPRAQADRAAYARRVRTMLEGTPGLEIIQGTVTDIAVEGRGQLLAGQTATGVVLADGRCLPAAAVVLTAGTFLRGLIHCGSRQFAGGRLGEPSSEQLSDSLERMGFGLGRLKTGTPPRVRRDSIDFGRLQAQPGDDEPVPFSFLTDRIEQPQTCCWITYTNPATHALIRANLHLAPMYSGQIRSTGPRYCPSIEDKVVRFADKDRHQIFLEPEGTDSERIYCNGIPTSLPVDVQRPMVRSIEGMERAEILQYGYAVEYDYVPPDQLHATLESKPVAGLFLAGQINGTSGYEEAAGQGLLAGVNAGRLVQGREPIVLRRDQAYIGVMIDDLVTRPPTEPYRMFTSRAEYRLHLRSDNADQRLTPLGREVGLVGEDRWQRFVDKQDQLAQARRFVQTHRRDGRSLAEWLRRPEVTWRELVDGDATFAASILDQIEIELKYSGYLDRQRRQIERFSELESRPLPADLDYARVDQLRAEARERLSAVAPRSLGQASRISGITPADLTILMIHLQRKARPRRGS